MQVRPEQPADFDEIRVLVAAAFGSQVEADLVDRIRATPEYRPEYSLVADDRGDLVGHVMLDGCVVRSEAGNRPVLMLSPLAVRPDRQGQGIGTALIEAAIALADKDGEPFVVLEGSPVYYGARGFVPALDHGLQLRLPDWAPAEAAQVRLLSAYDPADRSLRGPVVYPSSFDALY
ncbi:N-acetyltransferase [Calidifontibacter sp. DB0510]|uniref:N-acetyltransferase n=1 Tax=Metallococcus carri TaxID=1656884 RepID=A0A967B6Z8_9MICO|nr:N-acetyltransferase [Metallococcus carri]NHN55871.1 N-acetyltransferase [Metallococcus carri]NOP38441.1 N-acetyltransferase [Calidifontibacter sp. DB2511S]